MNCYNEILCEQRYLIGVKDFINCDKPELNLFIDQVPGMNLKYASKIAPEQAQSGGDFFRDCIRTATQMVFDEFTDELQKYFDFNSIVETRNLVNFTSQLNMLSNTERGIILKRWRSEMAQIYIEELYIRVNQSGQATIKIIDGANTDEVAVNLIANVNNIIKINKKYNSEEIKILMSNASFETYRYELNNVGQSCGSCGGGLGRHYIVRGWNGTQEDANPYGIGVRTNVRCFEENVICSLIPRMGFLFLYKSAIIVCKNHIATDRMNYLATFGKDIAVTVMEDSEIEYRKKWDTLLKITYKYLKDTKGECIKCNGTQIRQDLP